MKKKTLILALAICVLLSACGSTAAKTEAVVKEEKSEEVSTENTAESTPSEEAFSETAKSENSSDSVSEIDGTKDKLEATGNVEVDKGLFSVTLTIPAEYVDTLGITKESLEDDSKQDGIKEAKMNSDGSVTYVMTKEKHRELVNAMKESIDESMKEMIGSENYPNITDVKANDDYTSFTVTTKSKELSVEESFSIMGFYIFGALYNIYDGKDVDNIHVDFVNVDTGEIINSADSKDDEVSDADTSVAE